MRYYYYIEIDGAPVGVVDESSVPLAIAYAIAHGVTGEISTREVSACDMLSIGALRSVGGSAPDAKLVSRLIDDGEFGRALDLAAELNRKEYGP